MMFKSGSTEMLTICFDFFFTSKSKLYQHLRFLLAYLDFIFEFQSSFSAAQNGRICPDTQKYEFHLNCLEHSICISLVISLLLRLIFAIQNLLRSKGIVKFSSYSVESEQSTMKVLVKKSIHELVVHSLCLCIS